MGFIPTNVLEKHLEETNMENKKKRVVAQSIEEKKGKTFADYQDEFEYLISAGIALNVQAISTPVFPLIESSGKNLLKLYHKYKHPKQLKEVSF